MRSGISAGSAGDLIYPVSDNLTHDLIGEWHVGGEPDSPLRQLEGCELAAHSVHDPRTEREDAQMVLRGEKAEQGFWWYFSAAIP